MGVVVVDAGARRRITSVDVAREVGLSRTTVSFVLNDTPNKQIAAETRQRVLDAAARLGYSPSAAARSLRSGRTDLILCLLPDWSIGTNVTTLLEQLSTGFAEHGLTFVTHPRTGAVQPVSEMWKNITPAMVIALGEVSDADEAGMRAAGIKLLSPLASRSPGSRHTDYGNEKWIGRLQAQHLAEAGHRHIGYAQTADRRLTAFSEPRLAGVRQACADLEIADPEVFPVALNLEAGVTAISHWRSLDPAVTAVCAYNDEVALALLFALNSLGMRAPRDLAIIGVDNTPYSAVAGLTTIATHTEVLADYLVRATVRALAGHSAPRRPNGTRAELIRRVTTSGGRETRPAVWSAAAHHEP